MKKNLLEKIKQCKTTKSAKTLLEKNGIEPIELVGTAYGFSINDESYGVAQDQIDGKKCVRLIHYGYKYPFS